MKRLSSALILGVALATGCTGDVLGPASTASFARTIPGSGSGGLTVMTRNIYLGADLDPVLAAPPPLVALVAAETFAKIQATNFPERAGALAREIAATSPHLVGLQEVVLYRIQTPGDAALGGHTPATEVFQDFLEILLDSLEARGLDYTVAVVQENADAEVPALTGNGPTGLEDVRLTDRDVILVRSDVPFSEPESANYADNLMVFIAGQPFFILRGWTSVVASVGGNTFRFFNTHLETQVDPDVQGKQAEELLAIAAAEPLHVVMVGDFNSDAGGMQTPTYDLVTAAGFRDVWLDVRERGAGLTCCHDPDLQNDMSALDQRIDFVFAGNGFRMRDGRLVGAVRATVVGDEPADRTATGLWPSDHAGVVARLNLPAHVAIR